MASSQRTEPGAHGDVSADATRPDQAFSWLERAADEHSSDLSYVKVDPKLDRLRPVPRFGALVKRMNVPP